ncbi:hypothetical protein BGZ80_007239 [Entomortierella chlamydospora]|uniref:Uncharacterized protein n=1 Tax=Entomortierella chlamydospora TaxID=101097 RepID=A0A9P6MF84_9FUNG|nr:hypothetical protein BGZ80_007239 [Entomortierella chlamydospora]
MDVQSHIAEYVNQLHQVNWDRATVKAKVRYCRGKYDQTRLLASAIRAGDADADTLHNIIIKVCPYYDRLHSIYSGSGSRDTPQEIGTHAHASVKAPPTREIGIHASKNTLPAQEIGTNVSKNTPPTRKIGTRASVRASSGGEIGTHAPKNTRPAQDIGTSVSKNTPLTQAVSNHDEEPRLSAANGDDNDGDDNEGDYSDDDYDDNTQRKAALVERRPTVDKDLQMEGESSIRPTRKRSGDNLSKSLEELREQHEELKSIVNILESARGNQPTDLQENWKNLRRRERVIEERENRLAEKLLKNEARHQEILDDRAQELEDLHKRRMQELEVLHNRRMQEIVVEKAEVKQEKAEFKQEKAEFRQGRSEFRQERTEFRQERAEFRQERAEFKQEKQASQAGEANIPNRA